LIKNLGVAMLNCIHNWSSYITNFKITPKPVAMHLEITYRCNLKCIFCDRWKVGPKLHAKELRWSELKKLLLQAKRLNTKFLAFSGGEPLLRKETISLANLAKKLGLLTLLNTNGTLIDENNVKTITKSFDQIIISIDSINPHLHDYFRGVKGTFDKALKAVKLLAKNSKRKSQVAVQTVFSNKNYQEFLDMQEFFKRLGVPLFAQPIHNISSSLYIANNGFKINNKEYIEIKKIVNIFLSNSTFCDPYVNIAYKTIYKRYFKKFPEFLKNPNNLNNHFICFAGSFSFLIDPIGNVYPCDGLRISQGNIRQKPLAKIWREMTNLRRKISSIERPCSCWLLCIIPFSMILSIPFIPFLYIKRRKINKNKLETLQIQK